MKILGIETSHDDTSIALLNDEKVEFMESISQIDIFKEFGGTIPELSSREHVQNINLIQKILMKKFNFNDIDYIAYTEKPGLIGTLQIGYLFAQALAISLNKPLIPIDHLEGHIFSVAIDNKIKYPALALLVSGGHSQLLLVNNPYKIELIGQTLDDAIGEAYDKVASKLQLGFPGGPIIDKLFQNYKSDDFIKFTEPNTSNKYDFSFSGLKTQVLNYFNNHKNKNDFNVKKIAVSFQETAVNYLIKKVKIALEDFQVQSLILAGGVSANSKLRSEFTKLHPRALVPNLKYATDNGAMIAMCAYLKLINK